MFKLISWVLIFLSVLSVKAQQIDWDKINSSTVLNFIAGQQAEQALYGSQVIQSGNYNNAELSLNARTNVTVQQFGDYNTLLFINSFTDKENKTAVTAQGNNNIIDITGSNSISDGMQVHVKGDNKTIFMRNY
ncbi:MAG: hypothetical protein LBE92_05345 [Chryseobacterium sp.]|uniref:hypothetical protein n=1 Tax=Chryseobacterium sp. TaxID=1871047 RepID=UPI002825C505|nr:hypothetical protein [Chryseobacterium sp.]MDR2235526.1 hypothetical protein [Chryseobacterium sp.]